MAWMRLAHRGHVGFPAGPQLGVGQHAAHDACGMDGRAGVVAPHRGLELAQHQIGLGRAGADHAQRAARSPYTLMLLEKELATKKVRPLSASARTA
jgi:hypothetical protein